MKQDRRRVSSNRVARINLFLSNILAQIRLPSNFEQKSYISTCSTPETAQIRTFFFLRVQFLISLSFFFQLASASVLHSAAVGGSVVGVVRPL